MRKIEGVIPTSYAEADAKLRGRERIELAKNTLLVRTSPTTIGLRLHDTVIVSYRSGGTMVVNSGGWKTVTTKARINAAIVGCGCQIASVRGEWIMRGTTTGVEIRYFDGLVVGAGSAK